VKVTIGQKLSEVKMSKSEITNAQFESTIRWAHVHTAKDNSRFNGAPTYQVDLVLDSDEQVAKLEGLLEANNISLEVLNPNTGKMQPRIKTDAEGTRFLTLKRNATNAEGKDVSINVTDATGNAIPESILIGNGSKAIVHFFTYPMKGKAGNTLRLSGLQVLDLVQAERKGGFKPKAGFTINDLNALDQEATMAAYSRDNS
jgi:hypothetical protein